MTEFEPSEDFVQRVMADIDKYEQQRVVVLKKQALSRWKILVPIAMPVASAFWGIWNMLRLYYSLLAPSISF